MQIALVFCALFALAAALPQPPVEEEAFVAFASKPMRNTEEGGEIEGEFPEVEEGALFQGTFFTRQDHTRPQNREQSLFTYFANLQHYTAGNPFYIYIKDAGEYSNRRIEEGLMVDIAARTGAALFTFDQRYFGLNRVTNDTSFDNLEFLTVEQTLADIAQFISEAQIAHDGANSRIILWGSGYGATIAAWARKRYPHYVDAVWSSSGSFNIEPFTFSQYDLLSYVLLEQGGEECQQTVQQAFEVVEQLVRTHQGDYIQQRLNLCSSVDTNSTGDIGALFQSHVLAILDYIDANHAAGVADLCTDMRREGGDALNSFARWKKHVYGHDLECFDYSYESLVQRNSEVAFEAPTVVSGRRQWYWLQCTQLGQFSITDETTWLPNALESEYHLEKCSAIFGERYDQILLHPAVRNLQVQFGSLDQRITNIVYTNGAIDPWLHNGMLFTRDVNATAILIAGSAKSADLGSISTLDTPQLLEAKQRIQEQILEWSVPAQ